MRDTPRRSCRLPVAALLLWGARGQGAPLADQAAPGSSPTPYEEHVQVITSKVPESVRTTPASVTVITGDELARRGAYNLRSALLVVAGIDVAAGGDGGPAGSIPELWGLKEFDAFLLTVDGVPWGGAFNPSLETLDLTDVVRIEILRGAAPVTYGATSFAGVINVVRQGPREGGPSLRAAAGSYGTGSLAWRTPLPSRAGLESALDFDLERRVAHHLQPA